MALWESPLTRFAASFRVATGVCNRRENHANGAAILVYHGVVHKIVDRSFDRYSIDVQTLAQHLNYFKRRRKVIPLSTLLHAIAHNEPIDRRWTILTFDDALESQVTVGAELLDSFGQLPWALSIPAGLIGSRNTVWTYSLRILIVRLWTAPQIAHPVVPGVYLNTSTEADRLIAADMVIRTLLHDASDAVRAGYIDRVVASVGRDRLETEIARDGRFLMATWEKIRAAMCAGVEACSHGCEHLPLNSHIGPGSIAREVEHSRRLIAEHLGIAPTVFVLPNGLSTATTSAALELGGYQACLTSNSGRVKAGAVPMSLPRFDAEYGLNILKWHLANSL